MKKIWNIVIWVVAMLMILNALLTIMNPFKVSDVPIQGAIILLIIYGLYRRFFRKKGVQKNISQDNKKKQGGLNWE